jgi:hypothetical protein
MEKKDPEDIEENFTKLFPLPKYLSAIYNRLIQTYLIKH